MHEAKDKTPSGNPVIKGQVTPTERGKPAIELTDKIIYPNSKPFEDAQYDYIADELPSKVAHWFEVGTG